jgi:hypothetical protein
MPKYNFRQSIDLLSILLIFYFYDNLSNIKKITKGRMGWTIGVLGFDSRRGLGIFIFTTASRPALGPTQLPIQWIPGAFPWE